MKDNKSQIENQYVSARSSSPPMSAFIDIDPFTFSCTLRSAATNTFQAVGTKFFTVDDWAFSSAAPRLWNTLHDHLRAQQSTNAFKRNLKFYPYKKETFVKCLL